MTPVRLAALLLPLLLSAMLLAPPSAPAEELKAQLQGFEEVPTLSVPGSGALRLRIDPTETSIAYRLTYADLTAAVRQAHIHLGQRATNGGVSVFLCSNIGSPVPTPPCPTPSGTVSGTLDAVNVIGPSGQGIAPGEFDKLLHAIRSGFTYVNVHTDAFPGGEIRGQIRHGFGD